MADLNALIAQGYQFQAPPDPFAQYAKMQQLEQGQQANQLNQMKMQEYQRGLQSQNALRASAVPEGVNPAHWAIDPKEAMAIAENQQKTKHLTAQTGHLNAQSNDLTIKALGSTFDNFTKMNPPTSASASPEGVKAYITNLYADPLLGAVAQKQMPLEQALQVNMDAAAKDPKAWATAHMGLTGDKLFESMKGTRQNINLGGTSQGQTIDVYGRVVPGSDISTPTTATAGEKLTAGTAANRLAFEQRKFAWDKANPGFSLEKDANDNFVGINKVTGKVFPIMVAGGEAAPAGGGRGTVGVTDGGRTMIPLAGKAAGGVTEGERKAATLLQRLQFSQSQLTQALVDEPNAAKPGVLTSALAKLSTPLANTLTPEARQRVESAQLDMLDAALTLGTGAAYTKEQLEGYRNSYFPSVGDGPKQIKDKEARLKNVISAAQIAAGKAGKLVPTAPTVTPAAVSDDRAAADKILGVQ